MQVGSLVICIEKLFAPPYLINFVRWVPQVDSLYVIRDIKNDGGLKWVVLEEGVIGVWSGTEIHALQSAFRELQPPMNLSLLLSEEETLAEVNP